MVSDITGGLIMQIAKWMLTFSFALAAVAPVHAAEGDGLKWQDDSNVTWARWQARLAVSQPAPLWRTGFGDADSSGLKPRSLSLMGDYLFARLNRADGSTGVLRATSGLVLGPRPALWIGQPGGSAGSLMPESRWFGDARNDPGALPYVGVGYSGLAGRSGWSFSADFGLMALGTGNAVRLGRSGAYQGLDDLVRELRLTPVLQVGASYAF
ncbi:hypothetical protein [Piscinibacter sp.]|uniref:hypothetical protein n=1 Tax=Piscinibacter sp. TaxID=1903157 RepID=UPI0035B1EB31